MVYEQKPEGGEGVWRKERSRQVQERIAGAKALGWDPAAARAEWARRTAGDKVRGESGGRSCDTLRVMGRTSTFTEWNGSQRRIRRDLVCLVLGVRTVFLGGEWTMGGG